jgi:hypothetical protein
MITIDLTVFPMSLVDMASYRQLCFLFYLLFLFSGCEKYYLTVKKEYVDRDRLASTFVGSPDPRQNHPPTGQELTIEWRLAPEMVSEEPYLVLKILYQDYSEATFTYPIDRRRGIVTYALLDEAYREKEGLLTYKAEIFNNQGEVMKKWQQVLWTDLITLEEPQEDL